MDVLTSLQYFIITTRDRLNIWLESFIRGNWYVSTVAKCIYFRTILRMWREWRKTWANMFRVEGRTNHALGRRNEAETSWVSIVHWHNIPVCCKVCEEKQENISASNVWGMIWDKSFQCCSLWVRKLIESREHSLLTISSRDDSPGVRRAALSPHSKL